MARFTAERHETILRNLEFTITSETEQNGIWLVEAEKELPAGTCKVAWGDNGTARVIKPNGAVKWHYERSDAQIRRAIIQTIEAYH